MTLLVNVPRVYLNLDWLNVPRREMGQDPRYGDRGDHKVGDRFRAQRNRTQTSRFLGPLLGKTGVDLASSSIGAPYIVCEA